MSDEGKVVQFQDILRRRDIVKYVSDLSDEDLAIALEVVSEEAQKRLKGQGNE